MINKDKIQILKDFRKKHKLNRIKAAELMGYKSVYSWNDYESGKTSIPGQLLRHIDHYNALNKLIYVNNQINS